MLLLGPTLLRVSPCCSWDLSGRIIDVAGKIDYYGDVLVELFC